MHATRVTGLVVGCLMVAGLALGQGGGPGWPDGVSKRWVRAEIGQSNAVVEASSTTKTNALDVALRAVIVAATNGIPADWQAATNALDLALRAALPSYLAMNASNALDRAYATNNPAFNGRPGMIRVGHLGSGSWFNAAGDFHYGNTPESTLKVFGLWLRSMADVNGHDVFNLTTPNTFTMETGKTNVLGRHGSSAMHAATVGQLASTGAVAAAHIASTSNPHSTTAAQVGALSSTQANSSNAALRVSVLGVATNATNLRNLAAIAGSGLSVSGNQLTVPAGHTLHSAKYFGTNDWTVPGTWTFVGQRLSTNSLVSGIAGWASTAFLDTAVTGWQFKFNTAGTGMYRISGGMLVLDVADQKEVVTRWQYICSNRTITNLIVRQGDVSSGGVLPAIRFNFLLKVQSTNDLLRAQAIQTDSDGGAENLADFAEYSFAWVDIEEVQ
jgi:hypothetical protein